MTGIPEFKFLISTCRKYRSGVLVEGTVAEGKITAWARVKFHPAGEEDTSCQEVVVSKIFIYEKAAHKCKKGQTVTIYLQDVELNQVVPGLSCLIKNVSGYEPSNRINTPSTTISCSFHNNKNSELPAKSEVSTKDDIVTSAEKEYTKSIRICLSENGCINPTELFVLDKIRIALNIKKDRGAEILLEILEEYNVNRNESAYKDAVALCLLDGNYITETERRLLVSLKNILHISDQRAYEIEESSKW